MQQRRKHRGHRRERCKEFKLKKEINQKKGEKAKESRRKRMKSNPQIPHRSVDLQLFYMYFRIKEVFQK